MVTNKTKCLFSKLQMCHYFNFTKPQGVPHATGSGNKAARKILEYFYGFLYNCIVDIFSHHFITTSLNLSRSLFCCCYCWKIDNSCMFWIEGMCVCVRGKWQQFISHFVRKRSEISADDNSRQQDIDGVCSLLAHNISGMFSAFEDNWKEYSR